MSPNTREPLPNIVILTLDSCRWDSFEAARMTETCGDEVPVCAGAQSTFTYAAHLAMLQGIFPHATVGRDYYDRYQRQLIRIARRPTDNTPWMNLPADADDIPRALTRYGYRTIGIGAMQWFHHPALKRPFQRFHHTGIHAPAQVELLTDFLHSNSDRPAFALVNMGETHHPYALPTNQPVPPAPFSRARTARNGEPREHSWQDQVHACSFLDSHIGAIVHSIRDGNRPTLLVVCGDHGECFGEDGEYGHGFYHPKVMEVPLVIRFLNGLSPHPLTSFSHAAIE